MKTTDEINLDRLEVAHNELIDWLFTPSPKWNRMMKEGMDAMERMLGSDQ